MPEVADVLQPLVAWVYSQPGLFVLAFLALPVVALAIGAALSGRAPAAAPSVEPPQPVAPVATPPAPELRTEAPVAPALEAPIAPAPELPPAPAPEAPIIEPEPVLPAPPEPVVPPEAPPVVEVPRPRPLRERLLRTRETLVGRIGRLLGGGSLDAEALEDLEALLFSADLGVRTAQSLLERLSNEATGADANKLREVLRGALLERLEKVEPRRFAGVEIGDAPHVVLVLGVNGAGKTTTIGKLAARYAAAGHSVLLGAGDTFRAAAIEQLQTWGERVGCEVIAGKAGGDPAAVAFDTVKAARAREVDVVLIDTAGRLQTKAPLMEELGKIARVIDRELPGAPHETLLVLDANTGQNALSQARLFTEASSVTGVALTKLDGTAKGGVIVGLADEFAIPVKYVGVGEGVEDLRDFSAREFVEALFADDAD